MKRILSHNAIGNILLTKGILITLLGIIHVAGAFTSEAERIAEMATGELRRDYLVWFSGVGVFIVFMGLVDIICHSQIKRGNPLAWRIASLDALFTALFGSAGVLIYGISPPLALMVMGWIALASLAFFNRQEASIQPS